MTLKAPFLATVVLLGAALPASAHHSFAMFDAEKTINMAGTVKELEWTNPHAWMHITVMDQASGQLVDWSFEMGSPAQLSRRGMKPDTVRPGDKVTVSFHPMKDGSRGGQYMSATMADGRIFGQPAPPANVTP